MKMLSEFSYGVRSSVGLVIVSIAYGLTLMSGKMIIFGAWLADIEVSEEELPE